MSNPEEKISVAPSFETVTPEELKKSADGWWRTQSATMALLKHAYEQISASERHIAEQEKRIRQLEDLAASDPLTGLLNRRGFENFFEREMERIRRRHSPGALFVLVDLDRFKPINDTYGHQAGDACLMLAGETLLRSTRILDGIARFGGDEFALLLTQFEPEKAMLRVQKIRHILSGMKLEWHGEKLHFGASIGVETVTADSNYADVYQAADTDLYADKQRRKQGVIQKA